MSSTEHRLLTNPPFNFIPAIRLFNHASISKMIDLPCPGVAYIAKCRVIPISLFADYAYTAWACSRLLKQPEKQLLISVHCPVEVFCMKGGVWVC